MEHFFTMVPGKSGWDKTVAKCNTGFWRTTKIYRRGRGGEEGEREGGLKPVRHTVNLLLFTR